MKEWSLFKEFRTENPDAKGLSLNLGYWGLSFVLTAIIVYVSPKEHWQKILHIPLAHIYVLFASVLLAVLFFISALLLRLNTYVGKRFTQLTALVFFIAVEIYASRIILQLLVELNIRTMDKRLYWALAIIILTIFALLGGLYFILYVKYIERLPTAKCDEKKSGQNGTVGASEQAQENSTGPELPTTSFEYFIVPKKIVILFPLIFSLAVFTMVLLMEKGFEGVVLFSTLGFGILFVIWGVYAYFFVSDFQKQRKVAGSFHGKASLGSGGLFRGYRLFIYEDGLEIRNDYRGYFIPYNRMERPGTKQGFLNRGVWIKTNIPGLPKEIRFSGQNNKDIISMIMKLRYNYFTKTAKYKPDTKINTQ